MKHLDKIVSSLDFNNFRFGVDSRLMLTASITFELIFLEVLLWHGQGRRATLRLGGGGSAH